MINPGERIAQMIVAKHEKVEWYEMRNIEDLSNTERGEGGFGHTGK